MINPKKPTRVLLNIISADGRYSPLALLYIRSVLWRDDELKNAVDVKMQEFNTKDDIDYMLSEIMKYCPDIIGFSCFVWNIEKVLRLSALVKKLSKDTVIVFGGPESTPRAQSLLEQYPQIDIVVRDEGEITFRELVRALRQEQPHLKDIKGITFRSNDTVVKNEPRDIIANLDSIPSPFDSSYVPSEDTEVCLETQRGCVYKCSFCFYGKGLDGARLFSMDRVKKDLGYLLNLKLKSICLMDPVFNLPLERAKEICRFIAENNKNNIAFHTEIRAELVDEEVAELFAKANIKWLEIGLQSLDVNVLRSVRRNMNLKRFMSGIEFLKKYDSIVEVHLILGLPGETYESFVDALEFALSLEVTHLMLFRLQLFPGTNIHRDIQLSGIVYDEQPSYTFMQTKSISFEKVIHLQKIFNSLGMFRANVSAQFLCRETGIKLLEMVERWIEWLNDDRLLLNRNDENKIREKFNEFILYFCAKNDIPADFYSNLLLKEARIKLSVERDSRNLVGVNPNTQKVASV